MGNNYDAVKRPAHYAEGRKYEPKYVIRDWGLNFNLGNAVKYLSRAGRKNDAVEDLRKAQEYIQFEIDALQEESIQNNQTDRVCHICNTCAHTYPECPAKIGDAQFIKNGDSIVSCSKYINKNMQKLREGN